MESESRATAASPSLEPSTAGDPGSANRRGRTSRRSTAGLLQRFALPGCLLLLIVVFGALTPGTFLTAANFQSILGSQAVLVLLTLGLLIPLTAGDYDLSVASVLTLATMTTAVLNVNHQVPILWAVLAAIGVGILVGLLNAFLVVVLGIDPFIVTLGTGTLVIGVVYWISDSNTISGVSDALVERVALDTWFGVAPAFYYVVAFCAAIWYVFGYMPIGRRLLFVGRGRAVSRLSGLRVGRVRGGALVASATVAALAGVLYAGTTGAADPTSGQSFLLPAFAAAFLGSTTIQPGRFNPWGALIAVYFLVTGITGLQLLGVQSFIQQLFYGGALIIAVALARVSRRHEIREAGAME